MSIQSKLLGAMGIVILVAATSYSTVLFNSREKAVSRGAEEKILVAAQSAQAIVGANYHDRIVDKTSVSAGEFKRITAEYDRVCRETGLQYIWSVMVLDGRLVFTSATHSVLTDPASNCAAFLEVHTNPEIYQHALATMKPEYTTFHDKWGEGRMVLLPGWDSQHRKHIFAASIHLENLNHLMQKTFLESLTIGLVIALIAFALSFLLARVLAGPIVRLTRAAEQMARGELDVELGENSWREASALSRSMNVMRQAIGKQVESLHREVAIRYQTAERLRESESRYRLLFDSISDAIFIFDLETRFLEVNQVAVQRLGYSRQEMLGMKLAAIGTPETVLRIPERLELIKTNKSAVFETTHVCRSGRVIPVEVNSCMIEYNGGPAVLSVVRDITERKKAERAMGVYQQQLRQMSTELTLAEEHQRRQIAVDLHDGLAQDLVIARNFLQRYRNQNPADGGQDELLGMIHGLLEQSVTQIRTLVFNLSPAVLYELGLPAALSSLARRVQEQQGVRVEYDEEGIYQSPGKNGEILLFQVVRELLTNAVKHASAKLISVTLRAEPGRLWIEVEDDGVGYDPTKLRMDCTGGGFGLFSIRERIGLIGGIFEIGRREGEGTRASISISVQGDGAEDEKDFGLRERGFATERERRGQG